jgi:hypothetical protein
MWVRLNGPLHDPGWQVTELSLEEIMLAYLGLGASTGNDFVLSEVAG